jgi:hypothetical protein
MPENSFDLRYVQKMVEELHFESGGHSVDKLKVLSLLHTGIFIKTQVANSHRWNVNTIIGIKGDIITMPFTDDDAFCAVLADDVVKFRYGVDKYDINFLCTLRNVEPGELPTKMIKVIKVEIWKNKRGSTRYNAGFICNSVSELDEKFVSYLINVSDSGGGVICKENLRIGSNIKLSFPGPDRTPLELVATIVRGKKINDNKMEYGIRYFNLSPDAYQKVQKILKLEKEQETETYFKICRKYNVGPFV